MDPTDLRKDLAAHVESARASGDTGPLEAALRDLLRLAAEAGPEQAEALHRVVLLGVEPEFLLHNHPVDRLQCEAAAALAEAADALPSDDPARQRHLRFFIELLAMQVQAGGTGQLLDQLTSSIPRLVRPEELSWLRWAVREWMPAEEGGDARWGRRTWSEVMQSCHRYELDEDQVRALEEDGFHTLLFHLLLWEKRLEEALAVADRHLGDTAWDEVDLELYLDYLRQEKDLERLVALLEGRTSPVYRHLLREARALLDQ